MSADFAWRLSELRKENNLSQKEAASCLGISQALLSHYEKGIRECGLDFLIKVCDYYDVTADYMLGMSDNRHGLNDIYVKTDMKSDADVKIKTIFRALVSLSESISASGDSAEIKFKEEMLLTVYRFALLSEKYGICDKSWFNMDPKYAEILSSSLLEKMFSGKRKNEKNMNSPYSDEPIFLKTVIDNAEDLIRNEYADMLKEKKSK